MSNSSSGIKLFVLRFIKWIYALIPSEHKILVHPPTVPSSPHTHVLQLSYGEGTLDPGVQPVNKTTENTLELKTNYFRYAFVVI